jgi:hypothetical protein
MYRLTARYADYPRIHDLREEIETALPRKRSKSRPGGSAGTLPA